MTEIGTGSQIENVDDIPEVSASDEASAMEILSRPRARYFLYYPLVLAGVATLLWVFPTDRMTAFSTVVATVVSCLMMWEFLFTTAAIRFSTVCSMGLAIGYGTGTLNSWLTVPRGGFPLAAAVGQTVPELANGLAAALMSCAVLLFLGELIEKPIWTATRPIPITNGLKRIIYINTAMLMLAAATGEFRQGGAKMAGAGHAGFTAIAIEFLFDPTVIVATVAFLAERERTQKLILGGVTLFLWLLLVTQGRMGLVYTTLVTVALARLAGYRWSRITWSRLLMVGVGGAFLFFGVLTYQLLRLAGDRASSTKLGTEVKQAELWAKEGKAWQITTNSSVANLQRRTLVLTFLSDLLYRTETHTPALGRDILLQIELVIPSAIFPNKPTMAEEDLASHTFGLFYPDQPNSILTAGALDFGIWGVLIYPIVIILVFSVGLRLGAAYFSFEVFFFGLAVFLMRAIGAEAQLSAYFEVMRNMLIFSIFLYGVSKVPWFQSSPRAAARGELQQ